VKFLVDANLPPALAQWLASEGHEARHVADLGMQAAADREYGNTLAIREPVS
jgi:predicted nuclease of predicted toxin-antitoxin system